jgi:hypothetical protein
MQAHTMRQPDMRMHKQHMHVAAAPAAAGHLRTSVCWCVTYADAVLAVAWSPVQPDLVATGGQDDKAYIWRVSLIRQTAGCCLCGVDGVSWVCVAALRQAPAL